MHGDAACLFGVLVVGQPRNTMSSDVCENAADAVHKPYNAGIKA
jgi:hypothetical protein